MNEAQQALAIRLLESYQNVIGNEIPEIIMGPNGTKILNLHNSAQVFLASIGKGDMESLFEVWEQY